MLSEVHLHQFTDIKNGNTPPEGQWVLLSQNAKALTDLVKQEINGLKASLSRLAASRKAAKEKAAKQALKAKQDAAKSAQDSHEDAPAVVAGA